MKLRRFHLTLVVGLFLFTKLEGADETPTMLDVSHYPQTMIYKFASNRSLKDSEILGIDAFAGTEGFILQYTVNDKGKELDVRNVPNFAMQDFQTKQLSDDQLQALLVAISALPSENSYGPSDHLVFVHTRQGTATITRCYDGKNLPKAMHDIYAIIGERFETAQTK